MADDTRVFDIPINRDDARRKITNQDLIAALASLVMDVHKGRVGVPLRRMEGRKIHVGAKFENGYLVIQTRESEQPRVVLPGNFKLN